MEYQFSLGKSIGKSVLKSLPVTGFLMATDYTYFQDTELSEYIRNIYPTASILTGFMTSIFTWQDYVTYNYWKSKKNRAPETEQG